MGRTRPCDQAVRRGRLRKAEQFFHLAEIGRDFADEPDVVDDAVVTLWVHAGIAASDVICCARLGKHAQGEDHKDAVTLLGSVDPAIAKHLSVLLGVKTRSGYTDTPTSRTESNRSAPNVPPKR
ncbi:hypothetical protein [Rhodococcus opacus]|uniref:Uncharacterized protein n=1 Tax=Rhodococcus opacus (strain B4) TaxID=632772 RepID=C1B860_RHOOB|nr:hypothetical protein [Rhodococcus opacus]BAH51863.1 hypothetical protein ROP_36160 [Rhodococcus opacus B4]